MGSSLTKKTVPVASAEIVPADAPRLDPVADYLSEYKEGSRVTMLNALRSALAILRGVDPKGEDRPSATDVRWYEWHTFDRAKFAVLKGLLADHYAVATANLMLTAVRGLLKACRRLRMISTDTMADIEDVKPVAGNDEPAGRHIDTDARRALYEACGDDHVGKRNRALLTMLYATGARRSELSQLDVEHWDRRAATLLLNGKGNKKRVIPVSAELARTLEEFCEGRSGPMFCRSNHSSEIIAGQRLSGGGMFSAIVRIAERAAAGHVAPHDFRRTFVGDMIDNGTDMSAVAKLAGHANINTTMKYDRRPERVGREAMNKLKLSTEQKRGT